MLRVQDGLAKWIHAHPGLLHHRQALVLLLTRDGSQSATLIVNTVWTITILGVITILHFAYGVIGQQIIGRVFSIAKLNVNRPVQVVNCWPQLQILNLVAMLVGVVVQLVTPLLIVVSLARIKKIYVICIKSVGLYIYIYRVYIYLFSTFVQNAHDSSTEG